MAELALKIGSISADVRKLQDGDIVDCFNDKEIKRVHAQHICDPWKDTVNRDGLRDVNSLSSFYEAQVRQFKIERIARNEIRKTDLWLGGSVDIPFNAEAFVASAMRGKTDSGIPKFSMYGTLGAEIWYDGNFKTDDTALTKVWTEIEGRTSFKEIDYRIWPIGREEAKLFLFIPVDNFDDATMEAYRSREFDESDPDPGKHVVLRARKYNVNLISLLPLDGTITTEAQMRDTTRNKDVRARPGGAYSRATVVQTKAPL